VRIQYFIVMNKKVKLVLIGFLLIFSRIVFSQANIQSKSIVIDSKTQEPLIYASVLNKSNKSGTVTDLNGKFILNKNNIGDSIIVSYIGFKTKVIVLTGKSIDTIVLNPKKNLLDEVIVIGENSFLYKIVANCRKSIAKQEKTAKTYLSVESYRDGNKIELIENYYNGIMKGYDIKDLKLKNGRIAYKNYKNNQFISTETSLAILYNKLFKKNKSYPINPLSLNKRKMKKYYELSVDSKYKNESDELIYVIKYSPKIKIGKCFYGKLWININTNQLIKIILNIRNSKVSPFFPIHKGFADIDLLELYITKSFVKINGDMYVISIDFEYTLNYKPTIPTGSQSFLISTNAFLYAYNYNSRFVLPKFHFTDNMYQDYLNVSAFPYNAKFWNNINEFKISGFQQKNDSFAIDTVVNYNRNIMQYDKKFSQRGMFGNGSFDRPYIFWSKKRIRFREDFDLSKYQEKLPSDRYNFNIQIYLDINVINDTLDILTKTIFDPNLSYYHFIHSSKSDAFINMYFDLVEIQRLELEKKIKVIKEKRIDNVQKIEQINTVYETNMADLRKISSDFFDDVDRGNNAEGMKYWNLYINEKLGLDNVSIFRLNKR